MRYNKIPKKEKFLTLVPFLITVSLISSPFSLYLVGQNTSSKNIFEAPTQPADVTILSVLPSSQTVNAGETFSIDVYLNPGEPIIMVQIDMSFDASLIQCNSVSNGNSGVWNAFFPPNIDNTAGLIHGACVSVLGGTVSIPTNCFDITFTAQSIDGTSPLDLHSVLMTNGTGDVIFPVLTDGSVTVESTNDPPTAVIDSISPNPADEGVSVSFQGTGSDSDGSVVDWEWSSSIDGVFGSSEDLSYSGLSVGTHTISFRVKDDDGAWSTPDTESLTINPVNDPPDVPGNPSPSDGATGVSTSPTLSVDVSDPNGDSMTVTFYDASDDSVIGTDVGVSSGGSASVVWSGLGYSTVYSWYVVADDGKGGSTRGPSSGSWSFTTMSAPNDPPNTPDTPMGPTTREVGQLGIYYTSATDPNGDRVQYRFNWDDGSISDWTNLVYSGQAASKSHSWSSPGTYVVKAQAKDEHGAESSWSSGLTVTVTSPTNDPPDTPSKPSGPTTGKINTLYTYSTSSTDPNEDMVRYGWDWDGDDIVDEWTSLYTSGAVVGISHTWDTEGTYYVKVRAKDEHNAMSSWSEPLSVTIEKEENNPPETPDVNGPTSGKNGREYSYDIVSTDPDEDMIRYIVDWGDGTNITTALYHSGVTVTESHTWEKKGTYIIRVKAIDEHGAESDWATLEVSMPRNKIVNYLQIFLERVSERFPVLEQLLQLIYERLSDF